MEFMFSIVAAIVAVHLTLGTPIQDLRNADYQGEKWKCMILESVSDNVFHISFIKTCLPKDPQESSHLFSLDIWKYQKCYPIFLSLKKNLIYS